MDVPLALRAERPRWLNPRTVLGLILVVLAVLTGQRVMARATTTEAVWAVTADLPTGAALTAAVLEPAEVRLAPDVADRYIPAGTSLEGAILTRPIARGELVVADWIAHGPAAESGRSVTIPVSPEHALGGRLRVGDRVDVYATFDPGDIRARTTALVRDVEVLDVVTTGGLVLDERSLAGITVALTPTEAARVIFAIRSGEIDVIRVEDGGDVSGAASSVDAGDLR